MSGEGSVLLAAFGIAVAAAILAGLAAVGSGPSGRGWGGRWVARLERLSLPVRTGQVGRAGQAGETAAAPGLGGELGLAPAPGLGRPGWDRLGWAVAAGFGAAGGGLAFGGLAPALAGATLAAWAWAVRRGNARLALRRRFQGELENALESMVGALKAGRGLVEAVETAAGQVDEPARGALASLAAGHRAGLPFDAALGDFVRAWPLPEVAYLAACLGTHLRTGGDVTPLLVNLGGIIRERRALGRELGGSTAEARSTAHVLALLVPGLLAYILWTEPSQLAPLLRSGVGLAAAGYAVLSWATGVLVIHRMLAGVSREVEEEG